MVNMLLYSSSVEQGSVNRKKANYIYKDSSQSLLFRNETLHVIIFLLQITEQLVFRYARYRHKCPAQR